MKIIVGLGNPEKTYIGTRHNVGYDFIDILVSKYDNLNYKSKFSSLYQIITIKNEKVLVLKPQTYMNLSGIAINEASKFYKINPEDILVIYDDMDINFSYIKIRNSGRDAGHNGIKSIISHIGPNFTRLKIGIDRPKENINHYVLSKFNREEAEIIEQEVYPKCLNVVEDFITKETTFLMNKYNSKK